MCLALDPEGIEAVADQGSEDSLAGELYAEESLYPMTAEIPGVDLPELAPDLSEGHLV